MLKTDPRSLHLWALHSVHNLQLLYLVLNAQVSLTKVANTPQGYLPQEGALLVYLQTWISGGAMAPEADSSLSMTFRQHRAYLDSVANFAKAPRMCS